MPLNSPTTDLLLRQPIVILNEEEDDESTSIPDKIRPGKKSDSDSDDSSNEVAEDLEGGDEPEELPLVKENGEEESQDWEEQL